MRCYIVSVSKTKTKKYAATSALSREIRDAMVEELNVKKKDVSIEQVDIPTAKYELLEFINGLCDEIGATDEVKE